jgi:LysM repeat protein
MSDNSSEQQKSKNPGCFFKLIVIAAVVFSIWLIYTPGNKEQSKKSDNKRTDKMLEVKEDVFIEIYDKEEIEDSAETEDQEEKEDENIQTESDKEAVDLPSTANTEIVEESEMNETKDNKIWNKKNCFEYDPSKNEFKITVYRGMTLSAFATHFSLSQEEIRAKNPGLKTKLYRGKSYIIPTNHLHAELVDIKRGDTLGEIRNRFKIRSKYDIRTWNCIPSDRRLIVGSKLIVFTPKEKD